MSDKLLSKYDKHQPTTDQVVHISQVKDEIEHAAKTWGAVSGISTGYPSLDNMIGGLKKEEIILIGGETNNGKSALAQNICVNVSRSHKVLFITLEMSIGEAGSRFKHMNGGSIDDLDIIFQLEKEIDYKSLEPIFKSGVEAGAELVILDYLQYLGRGMTLDEVAKMSKMMKKLARQFSIPLLIIVSLRKGDGGMNRRKWTDIEVDDLMGTSAIGYDTDVALIASRKNLDNEYETDKFFVKVVKSRNMALDYDKRFLEFNWDKTRITEPVVPFTDHLSTPLTEIKDATDVDLATLFP